MHLTENEAAWLGELPNGKRALKVIEHLEERVAYAEKARDEAVKEKEDAIAKTKEKMQRAGAAHGLLRRLLKEALDSMDNDDWSHIPSVVALCARIKEALS